MASLIGIRQKNKTIDKHSSKFPEIGVSASSGYIMEPASVMRGDNDTVEVLTPRVDNLEVPRVDNLEVPRFPDHNDEYRKPNGDGMVTSLRHETHIPCESTDILADNTDKATRPWSGDASGNIRNTHMDTCEGDSYSRCRDDYLPESFLDGHKINHGKTECDKNTIGNTQEN